jgi:predicted Zn-dependent protease
MNIKNSPIYLIGFFLIFSFSECSKVPLTNRRQLNFLPESQVLSLANDQYNQFIKENTVVTGTDKAQWVEEVGKNISVAVEKYFTEQGNQKALKGYNWTFKLVQDENINAFCMPGGKIVVFTGLFKVAASKDELAVVMGHEVAHAVAKHGDERMSQGLAAQLGGVALATALKEKPALTQQLFMASYGLGTQVGVLLPYSRMQETEADKLGLIFMAMAGYNPQVAPGFWGKMDQASSGQSTPELLATHPNPQKRIKDIEAFMSEAMKYKK